MNFLEILQNRFKEQFGVSLKEENLIFSEFGVEISYEDPNINNHDKYRRSILIDKCDVVDNKYIRVYSYITYDVIPTLLRGF